MKTKIFNWKSLFLLLPITLLIFSCNKKPDTLGLDLVDSNKGVLGYDTSFNVFAYSELEGSVLSDETSVSLLGSMQTATFGRLDASFYTQLRLSQVYPDFGNAPAVDSVIFNMVYSGYYGNINTIQTVEVHRLIESIYRDSVYYSNASFDLGAAVLGSKTFTPNPNDTILIDSVSSAPELRIPLSNTFGQELLNLDTSNYETSTVFLEYLKGLYLSAEQVTTEGEGAILYFNLLSDRSNVTIYYHNTADDSLSYVFLINDNSARVGNYSHDYSLSSDLIFKEEVADTLNYDTLNKGKDKLYLEGLGGVRTILKFPGLSEWAENINPVINEAKLIITSENYSDLLIPPDKLILFRIASDTKKDSIAFTYDQSTFTDDYFGGKFNEDKSTYTFRISLHIQSLLLGEPDYGLVLYPNGKSVRANGLVFTGWNPANPNHLKLKLTYTRTE